MREAIEAYATILAKSTGEVPAVDVAWQLRRILGDPNTGVPDAEVKTGAPVNRRDWERRVEDVDRARRNIKARIIASAHLLDTPFTNAPDQSPWTLFKRDMSRLDEAVIALTRPTEETDRV
jgi:hypothetical protein